MSTNKSKTYYSLMNSSITTVVYVLNIAMRFGSRSVFIYFLGKEYLGLNGLFTSILSMLSLAELGIGPSIVFSLYKPLAKADHAQTKALMRLYKRVYVIIGIVVAALGMGLFPFIDHLIKGGENLQNIHIIYLLYLSNSVISYFFSYNRSLLMADQKAYKSTLNTFAFATMTIIAQIAVLFLTHSYILYIICEITFTFLSNLVLTYMVKKSYKHIDAAETVKLEKETIDFLKRNTIGSISSRLGYIVVNSTDNLLLSYFVNIATVGIYSNYSLIYINLQGVIVSVADSVTASVGHAAAQHDDAQSYSILKRHYFLVFCVTMVTSLGLFLCINPLIHVWIGDSYLLSQTVVMLIVANFLLQCMRRTFLVFISGFGLNWVQRFKPLAEAGLNIVFSLFFLLVYKWGIAGVLLGAVLSCLMTDMWYEPYVVFKHAVKRPYKDFVRISIKYYLSFALAFALGFFATHYLPIDGFVKLIVNGVLAIAITGIVIISLFHKSTEFKYLLGLIGGIARKVLGKFRR
ncbi:MAG: oligosaccharide flippase family protein [Clostridiales Family XIII bacterium]|jgi:O-antigen/teichoic acid export membrane protein|nr:oligosaccharide flippase family protein [Clostridiales Family XIII bacterium]